MELNPQVIDAYKQILLEPSKYGFDFTPLKECFEKSEVVTAKHILFQQYGEYIDKPLPKVIFYIIMDEVFGFCNSKDEKGDLGYNLKLTSQPTDCRT